ncbi:MAG: trypsin-like peptidase domain-containing protein [Acidobacteria bacterium]|nr:trypsin-like peptidase domain-containing protein [Acidobacteriota bacterium]
MAWNENLTQLNHVLAGLYLFPQESVRLVDEAGLPKANIAFQLKALDNWHAILTEAERRGKVRDVVAAAQRDYPEDPFLARAAEGQLAGLAGPVVGDDLAWRGEEQPAAALEKILGKQSTLLPIGFLEVGLERARSVALVRLPQGSGSGFLTGDNLFVTNHHVLPDEATARAATLVFNFQKTAEGLDEATSEVALDPAAGFFTSREHDFTLCRVEGDANADWGAVALEPVEVAVEERAIIIQHPGGGPKQIAVYRNVVAYADGDRVQYLTDTLPGSSGSPVFDSSWRLVAVHHSGGHIREPGSKALVFRNEGIAVGRILADGAALLGVAPPG